jgi:hypothetical protein
MPKVIVRQQVTFDEVYNSGAPTAFYSANGPWWTHDRNNLIIKNGNVPLDPMGSPLYEGPLRKFLENSRNNSTHYGPLGLQTFMAAHAQNCVEEVPVLTLRGVSGYRSYAFRNWGEYELELYRAGLVTPAPIDIAEPVEVRGLYEAAHNACVEWERWFQEEGSFQASGLRINRKMVELKDAVTALRPFVDKHFSK